MYQRWISHLSTISLTVRKVQIEYKATKQAHCVLITVRTSFVSDLFTRTEYISLFRFFRSPEGLQQFWWRWQPPSDICGQFVEIVSSSRIRMSTMSHKVERRAPTVVECQHWDVEIGCGGDGNSFQTGVASERGDWTDTLIWAKIVCRVVSVIGKWIAYQMKARFSRKERGWSEKNVRNQWDSIEQHGTTSAIELHGNYRVMVNDWYKIKQGTCKCIWFLPISTWIPRKWALGHLISMQ